MKKLFILVVILIGLVSCKKKNITPPSPPPPPTVFVDDSVRTYVFQFIGDAPAMDGLHDWLTKEFWVNGVYYTWCSNCQALCVECHVGDIILFKTQANTPNQFDYNSTFTATYSSYATNDPTPTIFHSSPTWVVFSSGSNLSGYYITYINKTIIAQ